MGMTAILVMWPAELFSTNPFDHQKESPYEIGSSFDPVVSGVDVLKILMNSLDPDQAQNFFEPELGLNRL